MSKEYLEFERLNNKNIINFFSYKPFNFKSDLSFDEIENNYNKFRSISNCNFKVVSPIQKHTNIVKIVNKDNIDDSFDGVDGLITNFPLPKSTLIMLISALAGREDVLIAYKEAVKEKYRFFSYGDAMLIL